MRNLRNFLSAPIACATLLCGVAAHPHAAGAEQWVGRSVTLGGRKVQCNNAQIMIDRELPSEGGAGDDFVILNPDMLNQQPETVRIFVFKHECGHLTVGDSELKADCFAVQRGVEEHWLDRKGLDQVCKSFDGAPATDSHPSAARRCKNLDQCYAKALAALPAEKPPAPTAAASPAPKKSAPPVKAPATPTATAEAIPAPATTEAIPAPATAAAAGQSPAPRKAALSAWRCTDPLPVTADAKDPIAHLIAEDAKAAAECR